MPIRVRPPWQVDHCGICSDFKQHCTRDDVPADTKSFLTEQWYWHQDSYDDIRCWNAYMSVHDPSQMVDLEKQEAEANTAVEAEERAQLEKLKEKYK